MYKLYVYVSAKHPLACEVIVPRNKIDHISGVLEGHIVWAIIKLNGLMILVCSENPFHHN